MYKNYLLLATIFTAINYHFFYNKGLTSTFLDSVYSVVIFYILFLFLTYIFSFSKLLNRVWLLFLLTTSFASVYFVNIKGTVFDKSVIRNIFSTNINEALEFVGSSFYIYLFVSFIVIIFIDKFIIAKLQKLSLKFYFKAILTTFLLFFLTSIIDKPSYKKIIRFETTSISPINVIRSTIHYLRTKSRDEKIDKKNISSNFSYKVQNTPKIVVLVIGESARADRFFINRYKKETTPKLKSIKNLISFKNASSCDTSTLSSVPCLLLRQSRKEFNFPIKETSFVKVFSDKGFDTYWLTNQNEEKPIHNFAKEAQHIFEIAKLPDMKLLKEFKKIVKDAKKDTLIVIHTMGSHEDYNNRVPDEHKRFKPICKDSVDRCDKTSLNNSYDNTIYYTDLFLGSLIDNLKDKNSFLIYASDHGESLGEQTLGIIKRYGHATPYKIAPKEQTNIPFIIWYSNSFASKFSYLKSKTGSNNISHDNIFHTILGCSGFKSGLIKKDLNLCKD